jgi:hypothetical protein
MDIETWKKLLGKSQDDAKVKAGLGAAGVKKTPKLDRDRFDVVMDLKGHGMWLTMTDETHFKKLKDQDIGEGPLILTQVGAYVIRKNSRDLYKGSLPYNIEADMTRADVRKTLGPPVSSDDELPFDSWSREDLEVIARYTRAELKLQHVSLELLKKQ